MTVLAPAAPTAYLPPIGRVQYHTLAELSKALRYLRLIYNPEVRGTRRINRKQTSKGSASCTSTFPSYTTEPNTELDALRADTFERAYAIRWLTAFVAQAYARSAEDPDGEATAGFNALIHDAASLLAICAGTASAGTLTRMFRFPTAWGSAGTQIEVQVTDIPLENQDYGSVGAQTWGSACILAEALAEDPGQFELEGHGGGLRVLELGAGTGLVSLVLAKLLGTRADASGASVVATDFHPSILANLRNNVAANSSSSSSPVSIDVHFLDWAQFSPSGSEARLASSLPVLKAPFNEPFDLILGADIIYEPEHAQWIKNCVEALLRRPDTTSGPRARFDLVIPLRPTHVLECNAIEEIFPSADTVRKQESLSISPVLAIVEKETILCEASRDVQSRYSATEEVEYVHYTIGWCL
ncbi:uncharacterized protein FIBRA_07530 [Fibroporia radiculosa]|uniref:FAM86 N-terminal domain-containing protein n=1 Tax=Fibroporia radiculosa TaxID=599839 RepID=J4IBV4_9APHY|nr:uncharacterized protein FIBRA_07530 [Fibroporia radiculosa]CCM05316.1 predicted protein [Fibroporia radiculosa]